MGWGKGRNEREGGEVERDGEQQRWAGGRGEMTGREERLRGMGSCRAGLGEGEK